jgi:hypothetical protein
VGYIQGYTDDICLLAVGKFPNTVSGLMQWVRHTVQTWCDGVSCWLILKKLSLFNFQGEGNSLVSLNHTLWGYSKTLYVGQGSRGSTGFSAVLEGA